MAFVAEHFQVRLMVVATPFVSSPEDGNDVVHFDLFEEIETPLALVEPKLVSGSFPC